MDDDDAGLLAELRAAWRTAEPLLDEVVAQGRGVYPWLTIDADLTLAELVHDSQAEPVGAVRGVRAPEAPRTLTFSTGPLSLELEIGADRILGQVLPPGPCEVVLEDSTGRQVSAQADEHGFFLLAHPWGAGARIRCRAAGLDLQTGWIGL